MDLARRGYLIKLSLMASWRVPVSGPSRRTTYQNSFYYYYYVNILGEKKLSFFYWTALTIRSAPEKSSSSTTYVYMNLKKKVFLPFLLFSDSTGWLDSLSRCVDTHKHAQSIYT